MSTGSGEHTQDHLESLCLYALRVLPAGDVPAVEAQMAACADCRKNLQSLRPVVDGLDHWPTGELRPAPLWDRLSRRIEAETGLASIPEPPIPRTPDWEEAAPGIFYKMLATEDKLGRVTMLVRLLPGTEYPPHVHAAVEELYMLEGDLMVDDKSLYAGDYLRSTAGTADKRVWTENGCSGILITSSRDKLT